MEWLFRHFKGLIMLTQHKFDLQSPNHLPLMQFGPGTAETSMRLRSHLVRKHVLEFDSRRALMRRHRFFQVLTPEFGHSARVWRPCTRALMVLAYLNYQCLNVKLFMPVPRRQCSGTKCEHSLRYLGYQRFVCNNRPKRTKRMPRQLKLYVQTRQRNIVEIEKYMYLFFSLN